MGRSLSAYSKPIIATADPVPNHRIFMQIQVFGPYARASHAACAPADAVKGVMKQFFTNSEGLRVSSPVVAAPERTTAPAGSVADLLNVGEAVPWFPDDLLLRVHVFRI